MDINAKVKNRAGTFTQWQSTNPILGLGEIGVVSDFEPILFKIGDGIHNFLNLPYANEIPDMSDYFLKANIYNGFDKTTEGFAADARTVKILADNVNDLNDLVFGEYVAQVYQEGTGDPEFQYPANDTITVNPGGSWGGGYFTPTSSVTRQVLALRSSAGLYEIYLISKGMTFTAAKCALLLGDAVGRIAGKQNGVWGNGVAYVMWQIHTYDILGVQSDDQFRGNNGGYITVKQYK